MTLDIRLPIGLLFAIVGALLTLYGLIEGSATGQQTLGINVNLWWGLVLVVFGLVMLGLAMRGRRPGASPPT